MFGVKKNRKTLYVYLLHNFYASIPEGAKLRYAGRPASASPAVGYMSLHIKQQKALIDDALTIETKESN